MENRVFSETPKPAGLTQNDKAAASTQNSNAITTRKRSTDTKSAAATTTHRATTGSEADDITESLANSGVINGTALQFKKAELGRVRYDDDVKRQGGEAAIKLGNLEAQEEYATVPLSNEQSVLADAAPKGAYAPLSNENYHAQEHEHVQEHEHEHVQEQTR